MSYLSVYAPCSYEKMIERSRFIANIDHAENEEEARAFLQKIRTQHMQATHNCFAYVADTLGNLLRFSDDGEPQGTAGMPILEVLRSKKLMQTVVVITRYFGGIKLGSGGLVRAYSGTAADALAKADIREYTPCQELLCTVQYENFDAFKKFLSQKDCTIEDTQYSDKIRVKVAVKENIADKFCSDAADFMSGKIVLEKGKGFIFPFPVTDLLRQND